MMTRTIAVISAALTVATTVLAPWNVAKVAPVVLFLTPFTVRKFVGQALLGSLPGIANESFSTAYDLSGYPWTGWRRWASSACCPNFNELEKLGVVGILFKTFIYLLSLIKYLEIFS